MSNLICAECGAILTEETVHYFAGNAYCGDCLDDLTVCCTRSVIGFSATMRVIATMRPTNRTARTASDVPTKPRSGVIY